MLSLVATLVGLLYTAEALRYARGTAAQPGPGVYPLLVGALWLAGSVSTGLEAMLMDPGVRVEWPVGTARWRIVAIMAAVLGYAGLLPYLGHPVAATLVALVVLQVMGARDWRLKLGQALLLGLGSYYLFALVLGVPLPLGFGLRT